MLNMFLDPNKMADVLIRSFSKILSLLVGPTNVAIDNWTFQMFYKVTPMLLGACVILVCTRNIVVQDQSFISETRNPFWFKTHLPIALPKLVENP